MENVEVTKEVSKNKQLFLNIVTTLCVLLVNIGISFGLSRYIVSTIGEEAYGFVSLANNFVSYATIFTVAINSMASRFITIAIHKEKNEEANKYFSSVLIANIAIIAILIIPSVILIWKLENIVNISTNILSDVKILFTFIFLNFFVSLIGGVFTIATYCTNKLYLSSIKNMESNIIKAVVIIVLFMLFKPAVFYIGLATLIAGIFVVMYNIKFTKELLPNIHIDKKNFSMKKIKILLSSGLWNTVTNLGNILADGLDLIISNLAIDAETMGIVALAKTPGNVLNNIICSLSNVFQPQIIGYYSKEDMEGVIRETKQGMKMTSIFGNVAFAYIIAFGYGCCRLWLPDVDVSLLHVLCILTFINVFCGGIATPMYNIFTITNRVKGNAILNIASGAISTLIVFILIKVTNWGVYAIVGTSAVVGLIKGFTIVPIYIAKCLNVKWNTFLSTILKYVFSSVIICLTFMLLSYILPVNTWLEVIISIIICGIIGIGLNFVVLFNKEDRKKFIEIILSKLKIKSKDNKTKDRDNKLN